MRHLRSLPRRGCGLILATFLGLWAGIATAQNCHRFVPGSLSQILAARQGKPLVLVLWSTDCSACVSELSVLARSVQEHPGMDLVFVATDDAARADEAQRMLSRHGLGDRESWIFADKNPQRLRYEIDPRWYGELPRSYFYDHTHRRVPVSGKLQQRHLKRWAALIRTQPASDSSAIPPRDS